MTAPDLAAEAAELRSTIAGLRAEAAELAASLQTMASTVCAMNSILAIALAAREEGRREGRGELGAYEAAAQALALVEPRRAELRVVPGGDGRTQERRCAVSAELAARRTAAAAVLADYAEACTSGADVADRALWAARLADMLTLLLGDLATSPAGPAEQLEEIRLVLEAFDWETDDRQYALEQIDGIVHQGAPDHACPPGTIHISDHGEIYAAHPDGTAHVVGRSPQ